MSDPPGSPPSRSGPEPCPAPGPGTAVPPLPGWLVPRPRLVARLSEGVLGPLTVVVGPAGAGKSALVTEWAHGAVSPGPVVWVSCDGGTEPREVFWPRVAARLRACGVELPAAVPWTAAGRPAPDGERQSGASVTYALTRRGEPLVLVLEDFQPEPGSALAEDVTLLLRHASPAVRLVVVARRDPPLHLHRRRLSGELAELRTADLAFTEKETAALLAQHGVTLAGAAVRRLTQRTEGWAAGLRLAAMSMAGHPDPARFVERFAGDEEAVVSYLAEEVLDAQTAATRHMLLSTSILDRMNGELAAAVAGEEPGDRFTELVRENSFLQPLGQGWYRCHRMFRDVLRLRLRHEAPAQMALLHRRAAAWLGERDLLPEALEHALAAQDAPYAARLAVEHLAAGQLLGLTGDRLPDGLSRRLLQGVTQTSGSPREPETALAAAALALAHGDVEGCAEALGEATGPGAGTGDPVLASALTRAVIRTAAARSSEPVAALAAAGEVAELYARLPQETRDRCPELRALTLLVRGEDELRRGRLKNAERTLAAALCAAGPAEGGTLRRDCLIALALLETLRGRLRSAADLVARAQAPPTPAPSSPDRSRAALHVVYAWVCLARGETDRVRHELTAAQVALDTLPDLPVAALGLLAGEVAGLCETGGPPVPETVRGLCAAVAGPWPTDGLERAVHQACAAARRHSRGAESSPAPQVPGRAGEMSAGGTRGAALSRRERDVLEHLARTMTTEEIADAMYLSVNTVKTHLKSVYRKLEVTRRSAAVRRARELALL